jgi:hypothetical protein
MRTTLDIDPDVLAIAKDIAAANGSTTGKVVSDLARKGIEAPRRRRPPVRNGVPLLPNRAGAGRVTSRHVAELLDD